MNPLVHYLTVGGRSRRDPSPLFDTFRFLDAIPFAEAISCPLEAFATIRELHDVDIVPAFDAKFYRYQMEVERGVVLTMPPLVHYLTIGFKDETLLPNLFFDPAHYRDKNLLAISEPALIHYLREGDARGLACHQFFSAGFYNEQRGEDLDHRSALEHFSTEPAGLLTDRRMTGPPDARLLDFVRDLIAQGTAFDPEFYRVVNEDLIHLDEESLRAHYANHGLAEGRVSCKADLMRAAKLTVAELPLGFVPEEYAYLNPDLAYLEDNFAGGLAHYFLYGRRENRKIGKWQFHFDNLVLDIPSTGAPLRVPPAAKKMEIAVLVHVFYADVWKELAAFARNFKNRSYDIFINVVDEAWTPELHEEIRALCPGAFLQLSNDAGRDIGGLTRLIDSIQPEKYDVFAFMHTKKSPHIPIEQAEHWRRVLMHAFAGSVETADECLDLFKSDPTVGMIGAKEWRSFDMGKNVEQYEKLLDLLEITGTNRDIDYLSGFMFLCRREIIMKLHEALKGVDWEYGGDKPLAFHMDGQIAHGVERALPALARHMGYQIVYR